MATLGRLMQFVRPYWWGTLASFILIIAMTGFRLAPAWFTKLVIDEAIPRQDYQLALLYVGGLIAVTAVMNGINSLESYLEQWVGQKVIYDLRNDLYRHLQSQSMSFYDANQTGQVMSRVTNDVSQVQFFLGQGIPRAINIFVTVVMYVAVLLALDVQLTIVALLVAPGIWYLNTKMQVVAPIFRRMQQRMADLNVVIQEYVAGVKMIQAYNREDHESDRFDRVNHDIRSLRLKASMLMAYIMPGQEFLTNVSLTAILVVGALRVMDGSLTLGTMVAFQTYALTMWMPVRWIGMISQMAQQAIAAGERVFEILDTPLDVQEKPGAVALPPLRGEIVFDNVSFAYGKERPLLRDVDFVVRPGETYALVGPSGSGKSTLINLIPRFYDVSQGRLLIDGDDVRDVMLPSLRAQIGMVMQETFLFNMTIRDNIRYGRNDATEEEVVAAAKAARADDFIRELPEGYDTECGERGMRLSGGQRQRIGIARALLVNPRILILDEATSSVDTQTDFLIQQALDALMRDRTTIVIAHRLSTVQRANQILVMQDGAIVDRGTHEELLHSSDTYRYLYEVQFTLHRDGVVAADGRRAGADGRRRPGQGLVGARVGRNGNAGPPPPIDGRAADGSPSTPPARRDE